MNDSASVGTLSVSVVLPCLNEADTIGLCLDDVHRVLKESSLSYELIVADNNSTDASVSIAEEKGARVIDVPKRGYGNALRAGLEASKGQYMITMDADCSYHADDLPKYVAAMQTGAGFVQGCRFRKGGGVIEAGAMPFLHQIGTPILTFLVRRFFHLPIHDVNCGMRGVSRVYCDHLHLQTEGMECGLEILVRAYDLGARFVEVPITLHRDQRKSHGSYLRTFRDGMRLVAYMWRVYVIK